MVAARTSRDWAPAALLCKRFGVPDPFELGDGRARPRRGAAGDGSRFSKIGARGERAESE